MILSFPLSFVFLFGIKIWEGTGLFVLPCVAWPQQFRTLKVDMTAGPQGKWQGIATLDSRFRLMWYFEASQTKIFRSVFTALICACSLLQSLTMPLVKIRKKFYI
jgi:hypothetical protein